MNSRGFFVTLPRPRITRVVPRQSKLREPTGMDLRAPVRTHSGTHIPRSVLGAVRERAALCSFNPAAQCSARTYSFSNYVRFNYI
jgi:hypothetical protein